MTYAYLAHSSRRGWSKHKYIAKVRTKTGKIRYIYKNGNTHREEVVLTMEEIAKMPDGPEKQDALRRYYQYAEIAGQALDSVRPENTPLPSDYSKRNRPRSRKRFGSGAASARVVKRGDTPLDAIRRNVVHYDIYSDELYHHGILGQKWGVRRFQNKDGTRTDAGKKRYGYSDGIIQKGTKMYRMSTAKKDVARVYSPLPYDSALDKTSKTNKNLLEYRKYVTLSEEDSNKFEEYYAAAKTGKTMYRQVYKAVKDIKVADLNAAGRTYEKMMQDDDFRYQASLAVYNNGLAGYDQSTNKYSRGDSKEWKELAKYGPTYRQFSTTFGYSSPAVKEYYRDLKKQGYDAVEDLFGKEINDMPIILLSPSTTAKQISSKKLN